MTIDIAPEARVMDDKTILWMMGARTLDETPAERRHLEHQSALRITTARTARPGVAAGLRTAIASVVERRRPTPAQRLDCCTA
jgi:hypothetical protein